MKLMLLMLLMGLIASCSKESPKNELNLQSNIEEEIFQYEELSGSISGTSITLAESSISIESENGKKVLQRIAISNRNRRSFDLTGKIDLSDLDSHGSVSVNNMCPSTLSRRSTCYIEFIYLPTIDDEVISETVSIVENDNLLIDFLSSAKQDLLTSSHLQISHQNIDFGTFFNGEIRNKEELITISNVSRKSIDLSGIVLLNDAVILSNNCPLSLSRKRKCRLSVKYSSDGNITQNEEIVDELIIGDIKVPINLSLSTVDLPCEVNGQLQISGYEVGSPNKIDLYQKSNLEIVINNPTRASVKICKDYGELPAHFVISGCEDDLARFSSCTINVVNNSAPLNSAHLITINGEQSLIQNGDNLDLTPPAPPVLSPELYNYVNTYTDSSQIPFSGTVASAGVNIYTDAGGTNLLTSFTKSVFEAEILLTLIQNTAQTYYVKAFSPVGIESTAVSFTVNHVANPVLINDISQKSFDLGNLKLDNEENEFSIIFDNISEEQTYNISLDRTISFVSLSSDLEFVNQGCIESGQLLKNASCSIDLKVKDNVTVGNKNYELRINLEGEEKIINISSNIKKISTYTYPEWWTVQRQVKKMGGVLKQYLWGYSSGQNNDQKVYRYCDKDDFSFSGNCLVFNDTNISSQYFDKDKDFQIIHLGTTNYIANINDYEIRRISNNNLLAFGQAFLFHKTSKRWFVFNGTKYAGTTKPLYINMTTKIYDENWNLLETQSYVNTTQDGQIGLLHLYFLQAMSANNSTYDFGNALDNYYNPDGSMNFGPLYITASGQINNIHNLNPTEANILNKSSIPDGVGSSNTVRLYLHSSRKVDNNTLEFFGTARGYTGLNNTFDGNQKSTYIRVSYSLSTGKFTYLNTRDGYEHNTPDAQYYRQITSRYMLELNGSATHINFVDMVTGTNISSTPIQNSTILSGAVTNFTKKDSSIISLTDSKNNKYIMSNNGNFMLLGSSDNVSGETDTHFLVRIGDSNDPNYNNVRYVNKSDFSSIVVSRSTDGLASNLWYRTVGGRIVSGDLLSGEVRFYNIVSNQFVLDRIINLPVDYFTSYIGYSFSRMYYTANGLDGDQFPYVQYRYREQNPAPYLNQGINLIHIDDIFNFTP